MIISSNAISAFRFIYSTAITVIFLLTVPSFRFDSNRFVELEFDGVDLPAIFKRPLPFFMTSHRPIVK